jgi:hypothetical protein
MNNPTVWVDTDGIVHIRNSERGTLDRCPQQWWWSWRDGLRPKETATPLWFGTAIHEALADYYRPGKKRSKDFIDKFRESADMEAEYIRTNVGLDEDKYVEARLLGETMLAGYVERYGGDRNWDVIATEQSFEVAIPYVGRHVDPNSPIVKRILKRYGDVFILNGTFDGVYRDLDDKRTKLMEHKTAASISIGHLPMDNQAGTYWMVGETVGRSQGWLKKGQNISDITYNFLRKAMPDERPKDKDGYATNKPTKDHYIDALDPYIEWPVAKTGAIKYPTVAVMEEMAVQHGLTVVGDRSKSQPPPLFERHQVRKTRGMRRTQLDRLQAEVIRMHAYVDGFLPLTKSPSRDHCGFCPFREMCEVHESGGGWIEFRDAVYRATDPYEDHRKSA